MADQVKVIVDTALQYVGTVQTALRQVDVPDVPDATLPLVRQYCDVLEPYTRQLEAVVRGALGTYAPTVMPAVDGFLTEHTSPLSLKFPATSPFFVLLHVLGYLAMVLLLRLLTPILPDIGKWGPFRLVQAVHNLFLVVLSAYMFAEIYQATTRLGYGWGLNPTRGRPQEWELAKVLWVYYLSKIYEFVDTAIILLRKNYRQASFLHIYHHCSIFAITWFLGMTAPTGDTFFAAFLNSGVHVVMYSYYLFATLGMRLPFKYSVTFLQMAQFFAVMAQTSLGLARGPNHYPQFCRWLVLGYMVSLLVLFYNFLYHGLSEQKSGSGKKHGKSGAEKKKHKKAAEEPAEPVSSKKKDKKKAQKQQEEEEEVYEAPERTKEERLARKAEKLARSEAKKEAFRIKQEQERLAEEERRNAWKKNNNKKSGQDSQNSKAAAAEASAGWQVVKSGKKHR